MVLAIIGVVVSLTLSGVQKVRAAGARAKCQNNLRQIALAAQNHHATAQQFPLGVTPPGDPREPYPYLSWSARLLPHLEQGALWEQTTRAFRTASSFQSDPAHVHRATPLAVFSCPSDGRTAAPAEFKLESGGTLSHGLTSYLGVQGVNRFRADGVFTFGRAFGVADITDGTSNTLLVGERPPSFDLHFGWWYAGEGMTKDGDVDSVMGVRARCRRPGYCDECGDDPLRYQSGAFDKKCSMLHFWSPHSGGANFAFADGSVRFLRYSADDIMPALATRAGGEVVAVPD